MPLLEVVQTKQLSASIRLTDTTATQVDQYAAFIHACADDVVEQALTYVFSKDRDFQEFLKTPGAGGIGCEEARNRGVVGCSKGRRSGGIESMIPHLNRWQNQNGAAHRIKVDTPPLIGRCGKA